MLSLGSYVSEPDKADALKGNAEIVTLDTHEGPLADHASVVLPVSSWAESDGTFVNAKGLSQLSERAIVPQGDSLPAWQMLGLLAQALGKPLPWRKLKELQAALGAKIAGPSSVRPSAQLGA